LLIVTKTEGDTVELRKYCEEPVRALIKHKCNCGQLLLVWLDIKKTFELALARRIAAKPKKGAFLDDIDIRYKNYALKPKPMMQAVIFCVMDVSGSMDQGRKDLAKKFYFLLYLFLKKNYQKIELVFIRHHTTAIESTEDEFFYSKVTGGTVVSSALHLTDTIIKERYPLDAWNVYIAQTGDGDNWNADNRYCAELLDKLIPMCQYFMYLQVIDRNTDYMQLINNFKIKYQTVAAAFCSDSSSMFKAFAEFFKKED